MKYIIKNRLRKYIKYIRINTKYNCDNFSIIKINIFFFIKRFLITKKIATAIIINKIIIIFIKTFIKTRYLYK